ncbi:MAG: ornithine cyclodeaminase family protein [marine bacterium B5-7]|nr:MAG: ornithine cyclodeaminase family protein [marine bacterium B5-7]
MTKVHTLEEIQAVTENMDFTSAIEEGFIAYSNGDAVIPPVGELIFDDPPGDTHIKYGYIRNDSVFVIKIASGFYGNVNLGLPSSSGLMLVFSQQTGQLSSVLLDEGYLTNVRTALAGRIAARYLAPETVTAIGVYGTGTMARMQVSYLASETGCREVVVWGRNDDGLQRYRHDMQSLGYNVTTTRVSDEVTAACNLIVTTTPAVSPLILADQVRPGTHITAIGSDTAEKQELDSRILGLADLVITDSLVQCQERGEIFKALTNNDIKFEKVRELGDIIRNGSRARQSNNQITVADLTGIAVQDIQIAKAVQERLSH